jgi:MFS family permease
VLSECSSGRDTLDFVLGFLCVSYVCTDVLRRSDGRRPVFLAMNPILIFGSLLVTLSRSIPELMVGRVVQSFGGCGGFAVGAGVVADIYRLEERGRAMGIFFAVGFRTIVIQ